MGAAPSRRGSAMLSTGTYTSSSTTTSSSASSYDGRQIPSTYRRHHQPRTKEEDEGNRRHRTTGTFLSEKNVNNAHNRYSSSSDVTSDCVVTSSLFYARTTNSADEIRIIRISLGIDNKGISIDEGSRSVLKYKTPHFRARATVEIPRLGERRKVEVGWIQVCHSMHCVNVYGEEGLTSWEFPEIVIGKFNMVSDSDGKRYPWYGTKHELQVIEGPTDQPISITVLMHDNFFPQITWHIPVKGYSREPRLTRVYRKQKFLTFLAVREFDKDTTHKNPNGVTTKPSVRILHAVEWTMEVDIEVDPTLPLGYRVKSVRPKLQEEVTILDVENHALLRPYALEPPNANNSQALIWRPLCDSTVHRPSVVVKPVHSTIFSDSYLERTKEFGEKLTNNWITMNNIATL